MQSAGTVISVSACLVLLYVDNSGINTQGERIPYKGLVANASFHLNRLCWRSADLATR